MLVLVTSPDLTASLGPLNILDSLDSTPADISQTTSQQATISTSLDHRTTVPPAGQSAP